MSQVADRPDVKTLDNFIGGHWVKARATEFFDVHNPAVGEVIGRTPLSTSADVDAAVAAAAKAFPAWRETPVNARAQVLFKFKAQLEAHFDEIARIVTTEHGKTLDESRGSVRRGIEAVEVACGMPSMMMGYGLEDISRGIDCDVHRQPMGVFAAIAPFNFPAMVPLWFLPFAVATGNTFVVKPSELVPLSRSACTSSCRVRFAARRRDLVNGARSRGRDLRPPRNPRGVVRRLDAGREARVSARRTRGSASRRSAARRTSSSSCRTPTWNARSTSSPESFYGCAGDAARRQHPRSGWRRAP